MNIYWLVSHCLCVLSPVFLAVYYPSLIYQCLSSLVLTMHTHTVLVSAHDREIKTHVSICRCPTWHYPTLCVSMHIVGDIVFAPVFMTPWNKQSEINLTSPSPTLSSFPPPSLLSLSPFLSPPPPPLASLSPFSSSAAASYYPALSPISSRYLRQLTTDMLIPQSQLRLLDSIGKGVQVTHSSTQNGNNFHVFSAHCWSKLFHF